jgi:hypothetical protein
VEQRGPNAIWLATVEAPFFQYDLDLTDLIRAEINQIAGGVAPRTGTPVIGLPTPADIGSVATILPLRQCAPHRGHAIFSAFEQAFRAGAVNARIPRNKNDFWG